MLRSRPRRRSRFLRSLKWGAIGLFVLALLPGIVLLVFDWNWLRSTVESRASGATGRGVAIDGDIDVELAWTPRVTITGLRIGNPDWAGTPEMATIERLRFRIELLELLRGAVVLPELAIAGADIRLERQADGAANWDFAPASEAGVAAEAAVPDDRGDVPVIGRLVIERGRLGYRDAVRKIDLDAEVAQARGQSDSDEDRVSLRGKGTFEGKPFTLTIDGGSVLRLRDEDKPYPLRIEARVADTQVAFDGTLTNPLQPEVFDIALDLSGPSLSALFPIFGIPLPPTPPYRLAGRLKRDGPVWTVAGLDGRVGDSDLSGDLSIDTRPAPPFMRAKLVSRALDFDDLAGFIGATPQTGKGETASERQKRIARAERQARRVLPDMPIDLARLRAMDMDIDFTGKRIKAPNLPLENMRATLKLEKGLLTLKPVNFGVADGAIGGTLVLDGRKETPHVRADLLLRRLSLKPFFAKTDMADLTQGRFGGKVVLEGDGRSLAEVLATSNGRTTLAMTGGSLSPLLVEMIGLDIAESLAVVLSDTKTPVPIRCAFGEFKVEKGSMHTDGVVVDTSDSTLIGTGALNLGTEKMKLTVHADPKDPSLLSANAPVAVTGTFRNPEISIDPTGTAGEGLFDRLVSLADPILALLPVVDLGIAEDRDCGALLRGDVKGSKKDKSEKKQP